jgi:hypothetical protein
VADPAKVFDVEVADRLGPGCGRHADLACTCDVDVALSADIKCTRAPSFMLGTRSLSRQELVQRWADWVYENEIVGPIRPTLTERTVNENTLFPAREGGDLVRKTISWPRLGELSDDDIIALAAQMQAGQAAASVAREWELPERDVSELGRIIDATVPHGARRPPPWKLYACNRWREGAVARVICDEIEAEWGERPAEHAIRNIVGKAGIRRNRRSA